MDDDELELLDEDDDVLDVLLDVELELLDEEDVLDELLSVLLDELLSSELLSCEETLEVLDCS